MEFVVIEMSLFCIKKDNILIAVS